MGVQSMGAIYHRCAPPFRLNTVKRGDSPRWERLPIYLVAMLALENAARLAAVDRVIQSSVFRQSETLRRLLRYLADKAFEGTDDHLKEYTIGIDALGKPSSYDPRQDSVVRIHVGRLRQKLSEYYLTEGKDEPVIVDLPKGHFKLQFETREELAIDLATPVEEGAGVDIRRRFFPFLVAALVLTTGWAIWATSRWLERTACVGSCRGLLESGNAGTVEAVSDSRSPGDRVGGVSIVYRAAGSGFLSRRFD